MSEIRPLGVTDTSVISREDLIFASLFKSDEGVLERRQVLFEKIPNENIFSNEYYVFYLMIKSNMKLKYKESYLSVFLNSQKALLSKSSAINLAQYKFGEEGGDAFVKFGESCVRKFHSCVSLAVDDNDFCVALEEAKMNYIQMQTLTNLEIAAAILTDGARVGKKDLVGYKDMHSYLNLKMTQMDTLFDSDGSKGFIVYDGEQTVEQEEIKKIGNFGIAALDSKDICVMEGDMISLLAPSKGGKSKFSLFVQHQMVLQGISIVSWSIENGYRGWEAMMRARHFNHYYNSNISDVREQIVVTSEMIRKNQLQGKVKEMEAGSWLDLQTNPNYGKMLCIDRPFTLDTFLDILERAVDTVHARFVCIDYLQLIEGEKGMTKAEAISKAYIRTLQFLKRKKIAGIFPAQLKQDAVNELSKIKPEKLGQAELRTGAGESYEVYKTPDMNLLLYGNSEALAEGRLMLALLPSRNVEPLDAPIQLDTDFKTCTFLSVDGRN